MSASLFDARQTSILVDRYLTVMFQDARSLLFTVVQAPLIGVAVAGVFSNRGQDTTTLYFVLALSAFFLGAVNSCREIVKERNLFLREKMYNLSVGAYLLSKVLVQCVVVLVQSVLLLASVQFILPLELNFVLVVFFLVMVGFVGATIGLLISAIVRRSDRAVALVPLVVIPQILFSDFVLGKDQLHNWAETAQLMMPVHWTSRAFDMLRSDGTWSDPVTAIMVMLVTASLAFLMALFALRAAEY